MSEHTYTHYRSGTFPVTVEGMEPPMVAEARWVRDHHVVHLSLPALPAGGGALGALGALSVAMPETILPSRRLVSQVGTGTVTLEAGQALMTLEGLGENGGMVHYLSIPGQAENAAGVMVPLAMLAAEVLEEEPPAEDPPGEEPPPVEAPPVFPPAAGV